MPHAVVSCVCTVIIPVSSIPGHDPGDIRDSSDYPQFLEGRVLANHFSEAVKLVDIGGDVIDTTRIRGCLLYSRTRLSSLIFD